MLPLSVHTLQGNGHILRLLSENALKFDHSTELQHLRKRLRCSKQQCHLPINTIAQIATSLRLNFMILIEAEMMVQDNSRLAKIFIAVTKYSTNLG